MPLFPRRENPLEARDHLVDSNLLEPESPDDTPVDRAVKLVYKFKRESERSAVRKKAEDYWEQADRLIDGDHWKGLSREDWQAKLTINKIYGVHEKSISLMVEGIPELEIAARDAASVELSEILDNYFRYEWDTNNWALTIAMVLDKAVAHRIGWVKVYWDAHGDAGRGRVKLEPVSNYDLFIHDGAVIRDGKVMSKYMVHKFDMSRNEILSKYNVDVEGRESIGYGSRRGNPDANFSLQYQNELGMGETTHIGSMGYFNESRRSPNVAPRKDTYEVLECWYMDDSRVETAEYDPRGLRVPSLLYPHGRIVTVGNQRLLYDGPNPFRFTPFVPFATKLDMERMFGPSVINQIASPQDELNKRRSQIADHATLCSNPVGLVTAASGLDPDVVRTQPGAVHMSYDLDGFKWIDPPSLAPEVINGAALADDDIDDISGMHEIHRGEEPNNLRSGTAVQKVREEGRTRPNLWGMFADGGFRTVTHHVISLFLDFVPDSRQFQFLNSRSMEMEYGLFNPQEMVIPNRRNIIAELQQQIMQLEADLRSFPPQDPRFVEFFQGTQAAIANLQQEIFVVESLPASELVSYDVRVSTGTRALTQAGKAALATQYYELGTVTGYTMMQSARFPNYHKAWQLKQEENRRAAEAAEQAAQNEHNRQIELIQAQAQVRASASSNS